MPPGGVSSIAAILGPTNTGKTHRAIERMLEHQTGMIGLPLRLLAREVYDRVSLRVGERDVALVTGEEKRVPPRPRYWICTVEAMPVGLDVDFLAIDEVQLATHPERGHVFTDRLLNARGVLETWFLGAETVRGLLERLVPAAKFQGHPRLSRLTASGRVSLQALPPRSAVVAFSATRVYEIAARLREHKGGAAVVLGALSPRARNAQVALYQAGEVDYVVATDAIGMGLNLDVHHVAFADVRKFDGRETRPLEPAELAQIAGRAGRYLTHGTFGTLSPLDAFSDTTVRAIESHRFAPQTTAWWRSTDLDFTSVTSLLDSLRQRPRPGYLRLMERADDQAALVALSKLPEIVERAARGDAVSLLWDVSRIPDFRGLLPDYHVRLLSEVFLQLTGPDERLGTDWLDASVKRVANLDGDIDTLLMRMAGIRTFTYIAHQRGWVPDAEAWQERTKQVEDALSDALHRQLVSRFVNHSRAPARTTRPRAQAPRPETESVADSGNPFAKLAALRDALAPPGSRFAPVAPGDEDDFIESLIDAPHSRFRVDDRGKIYDGETPLGRLSRGKDWLTPEVTITLDDVGSGARSRVQRRLVAWTRDLVAEMLGPLRHESLSGLSAVGRGLVYQLERSLGTLTGAPARAAVGALPRQDRRALVRVGLRFGRAVSYLPALHSRDAVTNRVALWRVFHGSAPEMPAGASFVIAPGVDRLACTAIGYPAFGPRAVRADVIARLAALLGDEERKSADPFALPPSVVEWVECAEGELPAIVRALGYRSADRGRFVRASRRRKRRSHRGLPAPSDADRSSEH
ncbi:MAG TPA: helicase-related protein [Polyangiaceae bacterium]|jgi:ATP-dependent RNA helicase SUPV3L1/SUV3|nr:helicase-related protein [Polyangiaceae bacterium]